MNCEEPGLLTDLYELTMAQAYFDNGMFAHATFSLMVRQYPPNRGYLVSAGLEDVLTYLEGWHFPEGSISYLDGTGIFSAGFLDYLSELRFHGEVWAIPEGRLYFKDEPVLEVTAPIIEAQLVETYIINQINLQSIVATKAARCTWATGGKALVDFSLRRTHGMDAGMKVARASYIAGFESTSNVMAGKRYGIPISGTMAHSFITSHDDELGAFRDYAASFPESSTFLIDTYDTLAGARKAAVVAREMEVSGHRLRAVRLDSGDFASLSAGVRRILDDAGLSHVNIFASGGLDEFDVEDLVGRGAPIDGFGVGTKLGVSADAPWSDMAYKLVRYGGRPVMKLSTGKASLPDEKQVWRFRDGNGRFDGDIIALRDEPVDSAEPLLQMVMEAGSIIGSMPSLDGIRDRFRQEFAVLDDRFKSLRDPPGYSVSLSSGLQQTSEKLRVKRIAGENPTGHMAE